VPALVLDWLLAIDDTVALYEKEKIRDAEREASQARGRIRA